MGQLGPPKDLLDPAPLLKWLCIIGLSCYHKRVTGNQMASSPQMCKKPRESC